MTSLAADLERHPEVARLKGEEYRLLLERRADGLELRLGQDLDLVSASEPVGANLFRIPIFWKDCTTRTKTLR